jgi:3-hydroxybutyryl-CoA dehydrogenase
MNIRKVAVIGAGTMGNGIAQVFAQAGFSVYLRDVKPEFVERGLSAIDASLARMVKKEKLRDTEAAEARGRISSGTSLDNAGDADFVVEAILEELEAKRSLFRELDSALPPETIFASNTSSISITKLAAATKRADRFIGMHFMNPVPVMELVELIRGLQTSEETTRTTEELARKLGKTPVEVNDAPGFISNRVLMPLINEAIYAYMEGVATPEAIDKVMKLGMNHPMGPLTLADFIGLDVCLSILEVLHRGFGDPKYRPCPLLVKMVDAGYLGRKSGKGFYEYR